MQEGTLVMFGVAPSDGLKLAFIESKPESQPSMKP